MFYVGRYVFGLNSDTLNTLAFQILMYSSLLTTLSIRERSYFWSSSPSALLLTTLLLELAAIFAVCSIGYVRVRFGSGGLRLRLVCTCE